MALFHTTVVDNQIKALDTIGTASGSIATFDTDRAENLVNLEVAITAVQSGTGTPSPSNPRAISGFSQADISVCGINLWDEQWELGTFLSGQLVSSTTRIRNKYPIPVKPNTTYYFKSPAVACYIMQVDKNSNWTQYYSAQVNLTFTTKPWAKYIYFSPVETYGTTYNNDISINYPSTDKQYHAYNGTTETILFGQTIYGGRLNVGSGVLTVTHGYYQFDGTETPIAYGSGYRYVVLTGKEGKSYGQYDTPDLLCNMYTATSIINIQGGTTGISLTGDTIIISTDTPTGIELVYELATSLIIQLDSKQIQAIIGTNNIYADTGDIIDLKFILTVGQAIS